MKRSLILILTIVLALSASTLSTLAYLTGEDAVVNTLTVGKVKIVLDEAKVDGNGEKIEGEERVKRNEYHLIPGVTYDKDPTVMVEAGSSSAYVRMLVTLNKYDAIKEIDALGGENFNLEKFAIDIDETEWASVEPPMIDDTTITFEYRYQQLVDASTSSEDIPLEPLFTNFTIPAEITGDELETIDHMTITVRGHAIQSLGFQNADEAWAAFDQETSAEEGE